uniref:U3 small nucleolar RNA-associated protein NOL7 C-terminal domain-containing protein n=1 Tax=Electrophorus electricus TaxID=8005 RepID=A0A4W4DMG8_ELEEL
MAAQQRGVSHSNLEEITIGQMSASSEDEGPEEVAFDASKTVALKSMKDALESVKRYSPLVNVRRKHFNVFKEKRLPQTLLEELETVPQNDCSHHCLGVNTNCKCNLRYHPVAGSSLQGNCSVMWVKDRSTAYSLQQSAMDFVHARLYGPGTQRTTNAQVLSLERKRGLNQGAAVQFVNKKLAEQKAKAERTNKRFIRKQKLIPS